MNANPKIIMQNYYATVFMSFISALFSRVEKSYAIKLFIRNSPYIHKKARNMRWRIFLLLFHISKKTAPICKKHVRHARPRLHKHKILFDHRSWYFCGYITLGANRKLNNKIITNSVHVRIEKWFAQRKLSLGNGKFNFSFHPTNR